MTTPKNATKKPVRRPRLTGQEIFKKFASRISYIVLSPLDKKMQPKSYSTKPWTTKLVGELPKGSYRIRLFDKEKKYLATTTLTK